MEVEGSKEGCLAATANGADGCFECNICLDSPVDPIVTLCGHLYCWPCIYKWLHVDGVGSGAEDTATPRRCPVCKASLSEASLVPLYGRGPNGSGEAQHQRGSIKIPQRPSKSVPVAATTADGISERAVRRRLRELGRPYEHFLEGQSMLLSSSLPAENRVVSSTAAEVLTGIAFAVLPESLRGHGAAPPGLHFGGGSPILLQHGIAAERLNKIFNFSLLCVLLCLLLF